MSFKKQRCTRKILVSKKEVENLKLKNKELAKDLQQKSTNINDLESALKDEKGMRNKLEEDLADTSNLKDEIASLRKRIKSEQTIKARYKKYFKESRHYQIF